MYLYNHKERMFFMALNAINRVREAELQAKKRVEDAEHTSEEAVLSANKKAALIEEEAKEKAKLQFLHKEDKARKAADEIMVTSHNASLISSKKLKESCLDKQNTVNKRILEIIKNP